MNNPQNSLEVTGTESRVCRDQLPTIHWSQHAIERAAERFGFDPNIKIPNALMQCIGARKAEGEEFKLRVGKVVYVCARQRDKVVIVTVLRKKNRKKH